MDFHELIINRRSIRKYTDEPISPEDVKLILESALLAPHLQKRACMAACGSRG